MSLLLEVQRAVKGEALPEDSELQRWAEAALEPGLNQAELVIRRGG